MPFWRTYYHIVWGTQDRFPLITPNNEAHLFSYLIRKAGELNVPIYAINGWKDHVHLIVSIPPTLSVAEVVKRLKGASSHYMNQTNQDECSFAWQRGYGVFTLGERQREAAEAYVREQKKHHAEQTTNAWLERSLEEDDGTEAGINKAEVSPLLKEERQHYSIESEFLL